VGLAERREVAAEVDRSQGEVEAQALAVAEVPALAVAVARVWAEAVPMLVAGGRVLGAADPPMVMERESNSRWLESSVVSHRSSVIRPRGLAPGLSYLTTDD
jgi:hypothetical protein